MNNFTLGLLLLLGFVLPAGAQTMLQISATGSAIAPPDEATASLAVQATARTAKAAQAQVNAAMAKALAQARAIAGVTATTDSYNVQDISAKQNGTQFQASQNLELEMAAPGGAPPDDFTALLGRLQAENLLLNGLDGDLSAAGRERAQTAAITDAIHKLRAQATVVAAALGQPMAGIKTLSVNVDTNGGPVMPVMAMAVRTAAPPPQSAPGPLTITANANAQIILQAPAK